MPTGFSRILFLIVAQSALFGAVPGALAPGGGGLVGRVAIHLPLLLHPTTSLYQYTLQKTSKHSEQGALLNQKFQYVGSDNLLITFVDLGLEPARFGSEVDHSAILLWCPGALWRLESCRTKFVADGCDDDAEGEKGHLAIRALVFCCLLGNTG